MQTDDPRSATAAPVTPLSLETFVVENRLAKARDGLRQKNDLFKEFEEGLIVGPFVPVGAGA